MHNEIHAKVQALLPTMVATRRSLHKYPETGWLEFRTAAMIAKRMQELGYTLTMGEKAVSKPAMMDVPAPEVIKSAQQRAIAAGADPALVARMDGGLTGFWADMQCGGGAGPCFALRFDIDANDVSESGNPDHRPNKEGFASEHDGAMHACGHDGHVAVGLAVAELLAGMKDRLKGSLRFIFEPGEEGSRGAAPMIAAGCVEGVDLIAGLHIGFQAAKKGDIVCGAKGFLATTKLNVQFTGKAAHAGAAPQEGKNALLAACAATTNMHAIARHGDGATRITVGKLEGGQGRNVIPANARMFMETRGYTSELDEYMAKEAMRILEAAAAMWDCSVKIDYVGGTKSGQSSEAMVRKVRELAATIPAFTNIMDMKDFGATEDFSHMMTVVQQSGGIGTYIQVGTDRAAGHHHECFDFDEQDLVPSAEILLRLVLEYLHK